MGRSAGDRWIPDSNGLERLHGSTFRSVVGMHIALVTAQFPTPTSYGARARVARLSLALAQQGQVHLFSALAEEDLAAEAQRGGGALDPYARVVTSVMDRAVPATGPLAARRFPERIGRALAASHDASPFDVVIVVHSAAGSTLGGVGNATVIVDEPEVQSTVELRSVRENVARVVPRLMALRDWRRQERVTWGRADAITVARARDLSRVHRVRPDTGVLVPDGVDAQAVAYVPPSRRKGSTVLFVGDLAVAAVAQGATELAERVLPKVRNRVPDASLTLAGKSPCREVRALESEHVRVVSNRTSVPALLRDHVVFAIPLSVGSDGMKDVLEPMACGMPVVACPASLREFPLEEGRDYAGGRSVEEMADRLVMILTGRERFDAMALAARRVAERYDWQAIGDRFVQVMMAAVSRKRRGGR